MKWIEHDIINDLLDIGNDPQYVDRLPSIDSHTKSELNQAVAEMLEKGWLAGEVGGEITVTNLGCEVMKQ